MSASPCRRAAGGRAALSLGDVADAAYCDALVAETARAFGRVDVLFNNAGGVSNAPIDETDDDAWRRMVDTNLSGRFYMARATNALANVKLLTRLRCPISDAG